MRITKHRHANTRHKDVELAASTKNAAQAKDHTTDSGTILFAASDRYGLRDTDAHDAGFRSTADDLHQPGQRVRLQRDQGFDQVRTQRGREERRLALWEGKTGKSKVKYFFY